MLRFSYSPTADMHIDTLRIALFNYIASKQRGEDLIVRIDDIDKQSNIEGKDKEALEILTLFGIEYTQIIYQSENVRFHTAMALQLLHEKQAFSCFCSDEWLEKKKHEAEVVKQTYKYDDACANLPAELVIDNTNPFTVRIKKPSNSVEIDSFVIMKQDKTPTSDFASAVDDMLNDISLVICDETLMNSTSKQEHVRESLNYNKKVDYMYLSTILGDDTSSIKFLLEEGFLPNAISNYLISLTLNAPKEIFTLQEALQWIDLKNITPSTARFDVEKLREINRKHLEALESKELSRYVGFADEEIGNLAKVYLQELSTLKELRIKIKAIFLPKEIAQEFSLESKALAEIIKSAPYFENYDVFVNYLVDKSGLDIEKVSKLLHILLTGEDDQADLSEIYKYIKNYLGEIIK